MLRLFFKLPPIVYFIFAALVVGAGIFLDNFDKEMQAEKALALESPMPKVQNLDAFDIETRGLANEVHIAAQVNGAYNYRLTKGGNNDSSARVMRVLFDPSATGDEMIVKAAIVVRASQSDALWDWLDENIHDMGELSPIFHINGIYDRVVPYDDVAEDAIDDEGLIRAPDFFYIEPFLQGRNAGLKPDRAGSGALNILSLAGFVALCLIAIGGIKLMMRRRRATRVM